MKNIIVNGADFGLHSSFNQAVIEAYKKVPLVYAFTRLFELS